MIEMATDKPKPIERQFSYCTVCGHHSWMNSYAPTDFPCKRNEFFCEECGAVGRNRHLAAAILNRYKNSVPASSLREFGRTFTGDIYITDVKEAIYRSLKGRDRLVSSEYIDGVPSGKCKDGVLCQDIQATTFADSSFDIVITEDVLEHVPDPKAAFREIRRILKPGGVHIFTIPVDWAQIKSLRRASIKQGQVVHHMDPEYHGDPFRPDGILAFTTYGQDVIQQYCELTGPTQVQQANADRLYEKAFGIYNNWVFLSEKPQV